jgi:3-hydroxyisobutyrate dehydrogenase-like beta-hydroxyacid dehydrogenase
MDIGFIGLGAMGAGIAENLLKAGHRVTVWNRSPGPLAALVAKGAVAAQDASETLKGDVLFSMLASDAAIRDVGLDGSLLDDAAPNLVHVNMATISTALASELTSAHAERGLGYVSAPVFGRPDAAATAQLVIVAAGEKTALAKVEPLFAAIARRTDIVGAEPQQANLFKIAGNFLIASALETMSEAFALLQKGGVDPAAFHGLMTDTLFAAPIYRNYGRLVLGKVFEPAGFALKLGLKDVNLARQAAEELGMTLPVGDVMRDHLDQAVQAGLGDKDWTAVSALIAQKAGL